MSKKKGRAKEARVNTPIGELDQKETLMHYNAVLSEEIRSKLDLVLESVEESRRETNGKIDSLREYVDRRFSTIELAFRGLKDDSIDMERRICSKLNRVIERTDNHEYRLTALEANQ